MVYPPTNRARLSSKVSITKLAMTIQEATSGIVQCLPIGRGLNPKIKAVASSTVKTRGNSSVANILAVSLSLIAWSNLLVVSPYSEFVES